MLTHQCFTVIQISSKVEGSHRLCRIDGAYTMQNRRLNVTCLGHLHLCCAYRVARHKQRRCWMLGRNWMQTRTSFGVAARGLQLLSTRRFLWFLGEFRCHDVGVMAAMACFLGRWARFVTGQERTWPHGHLSEDGRGLQKEDRIEGAIHHWTQSSWANCASIRLRCPNGHWFLVSVGAL